MRPVSETSVSVYVLKEGITHYQLKGINGADAHLKAADRVFILSGKANQFGEIRFRSVPWGRYKLTVSPPRHIDASPPTQVFEMTVEEPHTRVETLFDVDFGVTVSGRVLRADTKEPVEGFPLELEKENSYGSFGSTYSATGGTFSFSRVPSGKHIVFSGAVPGKHVVKACLNARNYKGFLPPSAVPTARGEKSEFPEPRFTVEDEDIEDIEYLVVPGVETHFVGQVVRADGQPVENAEIVLEGLDGAMLDSGLLSGADGRFDYSILLPEYDETIQAGLLGFEIGSNESTTKVIDGQKHITLPPSYSFGSRSINGHLLGRGSCPVEFKVGDTVRDIRLVLQLEKKELEGSTVSVRIAYEGGKDPERHLSPNVNVFQNKKQLQRPGQQEDGTYRIDGLEPGAFQLYVSVRASTRSSNLASESEHERIKVSYEAELLELEMPGGEEEMEVDVGLKRGSYLHGKLVDTDRQPIAGIPMRAMGGEVSFGLCTTDAKGFFLLDGLTPELEHTLTVHKELRALTNKQIKPLKEMKGIKPPVDNIVIMIERPE